MKENTHQVKALTRDQALKVLVMRLQLAAVDWHACALLCTLPDHTDHSVATKPPQACTCIAMYAIDPSHPFLLSLFRS